MGAKVPDREAILQDDRHGELAGPGHEPKRKRVFRVNKNYEDASGKNRHRKYRRAFKIQPKPRPC
jgi:hypothetical protein